MKKFNIHDRVKFTATADKNLDNVHGEVIGYYGLHAIVLFDKPIPKNYNPAIVISQYCLEKIK